MRKTRPTTEQIIRILREAEVGERSNEAVCRQHNISPQTCCRWQSQVGGMGLQEAQRLRHWERANAGLKKLLADPLLKTKALEIALEKHPSPERQRGPRPVGRLTRGAWPNIPADHFAGG